MAESVDFPIRRDVGKDAVRRRSRFIIIDVFGRVKRRALPAELVNAGSVLGIILLEG